MEMTEEFEASLQVLRGFDTDITTEVNEIKGGIEDGEEPRYGAIRELREETGVSKSKTPFKSLRPAKPNSNTTAYRRSLLEPPQLSTSSPSPAKPPSSTTNRSTKILQPIHNYTYTATNHPTNSASSILSLNIPHSLFLTFLIGISCDGFVSLLTDSGNTKDDLKLPTDDTLLNQGRHQRGRVLLHRVLFD
ncbi:hypothetical protein ACFE04_009910 [Oxalis oulophora]